jgi:general secretion pathway protein D
MFKFFLFLFLLHSLLYSKTALSLNLSQVRVSEFIKIVSDTSKVTIINPYEINDLFDISSNAVVYDIELLNILESVLFSKGYLLIKNDTIYTIVKNDTFDISSSDFKTLVIDLKYISSSSAISSLKPLLSSNSFITEIKGFNKILISDYSKNIKKISSLIRDIDIQSDKVLKIYDLKNSKSIDVFNTLQDIIKNQTYIDESLKPTLSYSEDINSIFIMGDASILKYYDHIIKHLDREKFQVYIQARVIEINNKDAINLGIKYGFDGAKLFNNNGLLSFSSFFGASSLQGSLASSILGDETNYALGASLDFLETNGVSNSISNPSILCLNNKECSIYVGKSLTLTTGKLQDSNGGATNTYERSDIGLTLKTIPQVSEINKLTIDISITLENIIDDGSSNATGQPVTTKQDINTKAILRHGESIIIGGLNRSYDFESVSKIPLLGDIPFVGEYLFSSSSVSSQKDNLIVILTPYIIENSSKISDLQNYLSTLSKKQDVYTKRVLKEISFGGEL